MSIRYIICPKCKTPSYEQSPLCKNCGANLSDIDAVSPVALVGALLENRYQLVEYLDEGAMAYVYRGVHVDVGSSVAVKILKSNFQTDERFVERFQLEARAAGALNHPNILSVITVGSSPSGLTYLISEFVQGITLNKLIGREGRISLDRTVNIVNQILTALDEAHSHGIIHRDIKPENIMITQLRSREEFVKLLDFGIARQIYQQTPRLTMPGELFGTPEFMAPEVIRGQEATISADLYAVGVVLYEMLTGHTPFAGEGLFNILKSHLETSPEPMSKYNPEIPSG
ncbi:MAG: serine/threonine protein kinase, partial [Deltaproteobacteria bacterium HGW-Deltaproteobacteria-20]